MTFKQVPVEATKDTAKEAIIKLLWEKQFEGSPWATKFHLIRRDSLEADYGSLADKILAAVAPSPPSQDEIGKLREALNEIAIACERASHPAAPTSRNGRKVRDDSKAGWPLCRIG